MWTSQFQTACHGCFDFHGRVVHGGAEQDVNEEMTKEEARDDGGKSDSGYDFCAAFGWYDDGECDTFCALPDPDCEDEGIECPDPTDPAVHYIGGLEECLAILFACDPSQTAFGNECGCGCIDEAPDCPDETNPAVRYVSHEVGECAAMDFLCEEGFTRFDDECGCGCIEEPTECPDPDDATVHYVSEDPMECMALLFGCERRSAGLHERLWLRLHQSAPRMPRPD